MSSRYQLIKLASVLLSLSVLSLSSQAAASDQNETQKTSCFKTDGMSQAAEKAYKECFKAYSERDENAPKICLKSSEKHQDPRVYYLLARIESEGIHKMPNQGKYIDLMKKSAESSYPPADEALAEIILDNYIQQFPHNKATGEQGLFYLNRAAACGNEKALYILAEMKLHDDYDELVPYDIGKGNREMLDLLEKGNDHVRLYAAKWLLEKKDIIDKISVQLEERKNSKGIDAVFLSHIINEYQKDHDYPVNLMEAAAQKSGLKQAYLNLFEFYRHNDDISSKLRGLMFAEAYRVCRGIPPSGEQKDEIKIMIEKTGEKIVNDALDSGRQTAVNVGCN